MIIKINNAFYIVINILYKIPTNIILFVKFVDIIKINKLQVKIINVIAINYYH